MKVQFHSPDLEGARWRGPATRELQATLRRLQSLVRSVRVRLEDVNGSLPGVDKRCRVQAELPDGGVTHVDTTSRTWQSAVELAVRSLRGQVLAHLRRAAATTRTGMTPARHANSAHRLRY